MTFTSYGAAATALLAAEIAHLQGGDPLSPVTVIVPSNYAGLSMRRRLGGGTGGGLLNVRFMVLARLAELLGGPLLAAEGKRPLTALARQEAIRTALEAEPGAFVRVRRHPATVDALDASFRELDSLSEWNVRQLAAGLGRPADVARLYIGFRRLTEARYSAAELTLAAAEAVKGGSPALRDLGTAVLFLPRPLLPPGRAFVAALATFAPVLLRIVRPPSRIA